MSKDSQPWPPAKATAYLNEIAKEKQCDFAYTVHARERLNGRNLLVSDVLFVLRHGYVYEDPEPSTLNGFYKYKIESQSPNSGARFLRVVAVPDRKSCQIKVITIMWRDES